MLHSIRCSIFVATAFLSAAVRAAAQATPPDPQPAPGGPPNIFYGAVAPNANHGPLLVFVHGLGSNAEFWWQKGNTMYQMAYAAGYRTAFISFNADNSSNTAPIADNAATFEKLLPQILGYYNTPQAWVVAHSKGGLDVEYAMLDTSTRLKIKGLFTLSTPNQGSALADWGAGPGAPVLQALGIYTPGMLDLQTAHVQSIRQQVDPILRNAGIPVFTLAGDDYLKLKDPLYIVTGPILQSLTGEANDGFVAPSETPLDEIYAFNMGSLHQDHTQMGFGSVVFSFPRGRVDGFEYAVSGFKRANIGGFGDRFNTWIWSLRWFKGKLYAGTGRAMDCVQYATAKAQDGTPVYPPPSLPCAPDMKDLPLQAEIWRYTPETLTWERVFQSPNSIALGTDSAGNTVFTSRELGVRELYVYTESDGTQALYAGTVSGNCMFGVLPEFTPNKYPPPRILRTTDGVNWNPIPQDPGTFMGDLVKNSEITVVSFRSFQTYKGKLFATATNLRGEGFIVASSNPSAGNDAWQRVSPTPESVMPVWDLQVFNNFLYVAGGDREGTTGYFVWKTDAEGAPPYNYQVIIADGAWQPELKLRSPAALTLSVYKNQLYVGTDRKVEMIRIHSDDKWDLVIGAPRIAADGKYYAPITGIGTYLDNTFTGHFWQMGESNQGLNMTTWDWSIQVRPLGSLASIFSFQYGFDFMRTQNGVDWTAVSRSGVLDGENYGGRSMAMTPFGWFLGTVRNQGGGQVIVDQSVLDLNKDKVIDQNDVNVITAAIGQPASGGDDARDLDRDGKITGHDAQLLQTQCTFPDCSGLPASVMSRLNAPTTLAPPLVRAAAKSLVGNTAYLTWAPVPGAVRYRVYRMTNRPLTDFLPGGSVVTIPGTTLQATFPQDFLSGKYNYLCQGDLSEMPPCAFVDTVTTSITTNNQIGWPTSTEQVAVVRDSPFQEAAPTPIQSTYFVRAEDVNGNLSEPSNTVGAPSKAQPQ